ncbi:MAG: glycosyltransferase [Leeuwenhoekiella sp.]|jgi:glycosyltransferase involved in cell wall biosynthesis|uniref:glycosyltransferase n=1 Tax=Leeuwenhoekiella TaxID=283735 RepID=UPI000C4ACDF5|nr:MULTISPECIES: glycosyltransferase [Leeuwenhoekiella]MAO44657.1 glycosyl transferase family 2 [Leeuwenhoekiella sp.]MBQ53204.1 glycosyl transferase family 2 [Leeuwenhoekiella sp.]HCW64214.1 glycosyl transferase family 2 [Leeuwenhoekiella sp.]|tara:strand:+ start:1222 stop:2004 length:783 start_codon:yes stop_codon:yes gene_type:complete
MLLSVVIRTKNQAPALEFLLKNLTQRYADDIDEIVVIDNLSTDRSQEVTLKFEARFETIKEFSYGKSANFAAAKASNPIVVIFSAHSYPVSHDFFKLIRERFKANANLAGLRCLHSSNDYKQYINGITANEDPNRSGLIFSGSAFAKAVWQKYPFREDVATFEDKEWTSRVLSEGYDIELVPAIFNYEIKRSKQQELFRYKNDLKGNYQLWHQEVAIWSGFKGFIATFVRSGIQFVTNIWYALLRLIIIIRFNFKKPKKF